MISCLQKIRGKKRRDRELLQIKRNLRDISNQGNVWLVLNTALNINWTLDDTKIVFFFLHVIMLLWLIYIFKSLHFGDTLRSEITSEICFKIIQGRGEIELGRNRKQNWPYWLFQSHYSSILLTFVGLLLNVYNKKVFFSVCLLD